MRVWDMNNANIIPTYYRIHTDGETQEGECEVPKSIWDYEVMEFSDFTVGAPENPVITTIIQKKELPIQMIDISYWTTYPTRDNDQLAYLGCLMSEEEE